MDRDDRYVHDRWVPPLSLAVPLVAAATLLAVRPGVVLNALRSPLAWLTISGVMLLSFGVRAALRRAGAPPRLTRASGTAVVLVFAVLLLAPSFRQRTLLETLPTPAAARAAGSVVEPAAIAPVPTRGPVAMLVAPAAPAAPAEAPPLAPAPPTERSAALDGIGHTASGTISLRDVDGVTYLVFKDVDIEGSVGPSVHLVRNGSRTPGGGVRLGPLKAERGSFSYRLPASVDGSRSWSVLVWCDPYDTPIAAADPR